MVPPDKSPDTIVKIDKPHLPFGQHVDVITPMPGIGASKIRINGNGQTISNQILTPGGGKANV